MDKDAAANWTAQPIAGNIIDRIQELAVAGGTLFVGRGYAHKLAISISAEQADLKGKTKRRDLV